LDLVARIHIDLYDGDAASAHERALEWWPRMRRSLLLQVQYVRVAMLDLLGRSTLARAVATPGPLGDRLLREVLRTAKRLLRERVPWASALGQVLLAGAATARGEPNEAVVSALTRAAEYLDAAGMGLHAAVVRSRLGPAMGGEEGHALATAMDRWFAAQGVVNPERLSQVYLPSVRSSSRDR
jgi:hypothetical protein